MEEDGGGSRGPASEEFGDLDSDADGIYDIIDEDADWGEGPRGYEGGEGIGMGQPGTLGHGAGTGYGYPGDVDLPIARDADVWDEDEETRRLIEALENGEFDDLPEAAAGAPISQCEAHVDTPGEIIVYCDMINWDDGSNNITTARVPVEGSVDATLNRIAYSVAGGWEKLSVGRQDAALCVVGRAETQPDENGLTVRECPPWMPPIKDQIDAGAGSFDTGRIAHHAPKEMVTGQPYMLEIAIQPITRNLDEDRADEILRETMGTGLLPGSTETPFAMSFDTVQASSVMAASLTAYGFDVLQVGAEEQAVKADAPTKWQWMVKPTESGSGFLSFSLSQRLQQDGERFDRVVKTIPLLITVRSIDELLADDAPPAITAGAGARGASDAMPGPATLMSPTAPAAADGSCSWTDGTDADRFALVLSNLAYSPPISQLSLTHTDGDRVAGALASTGFSVMRCRDLGQSETVKAMREIGRRSLARKQAGAKPVTFFYYSGHGVNVEDGNYVLPVDLPGASPEEIEDGAVSFEKIFNLMSTTVASTAFIVFDACRTVMDDESRGMVRAYSPVTWSTGVFQAYATQPGQTASDDGTYSEELAAMLPTSGLPANVIFKRVQDAVAQRTNNAQRPNYLDDTTGGEFYFRQ